MAPTRTLTDENWDYLLSLLPGDWEAQAKATGAVRRLRGASSLSSLLRVLLLHIGHGCSLRTASVVGKAAGWISMSDVALHKKLALCEPWLHQLCLGLLADSQMSLPAPHRGTLQERVPARLCAVRKSVEAAILAKRKLQRRAQRNGQQLRSATLEHSSWIVVLTTVATATLTDDAVLQWYRVRWQIELAFKRLKSLGDVGHLPKSDERSSRAWVYGKLLIALLTEKMQRHAASLSPWGGRWLDQDPPPELLA